MKLYFQIFILLIKKYILGYRTGEVIRDFCKKMGITYIKFAQILATQNYGNIFTETDRKVLSSICDNINPISYDKIYKILQNEYDNKVEDIFSFIDSKPVGSASISQVHKAQLKTGEMVAIKVKRKDVTRNIQKDIIRMKKLIHRYGKFVKFKNFIASDNALNLYLNWIYEETDFNHEIQNIKTYKEFADSVNGNVENTSNIMVPKLYEEYSTENIIVMEFIEHKTINKIDLTEENKKRISFALNSYYKLTFSALFHDQKIVFHGDPHGGNIYIDDDNNIGFLDMGLLFVMSDEESKLIRQLYLSVYSGNYQKLYDIFIPYGKFNPQTEFKFKEEIKKYSEEVKQKDITHYFVDVVNICLYYQFLPPNFFFNLTKAFMCLNGINTFIDNSIDGKELLKEQTIEFLIRRSLDDYSNLAINGFKIIPNLFIETYKNGISKGLAKEIKNTEKVVEDLKIAYDNSKELLGLIKENVKI